METPPKQRRRRSLRIIRASSNFHSPPSSSPYGSAWINRDKEEVDSSHAAVNFPYLLNHADEFGSAGEPHNILEDAAVQETFCSRGVESGDYSEARLQGYIEDGEPKGNVSEIAQSYDSFSFSPDMPLDANSFQSEECRLGITPTRIEWHTLSPFSERLFGGKIQDETLGSDGESAAGFQIADNSQEAHTLKSMYHFDSALDWSDNLSFESSPVPEQDLVIDNLEGCVDYDSGQNLSEQGMQLQVSPQTQNMSNEEQLSSTFTVIYLSPTNESMPVESISSNLSERESADTMNDTSLVVKLSNMNIDSMGELPPNAVSEIGPSLFDENLCPRRPSSPETTKMDDFIMEQIHTDLQLQDVGTSLNPYANHDSSVSVDFFGSVLQSGGLGEINLEESLVSKKRTKKRKSSRRLSRRFDMQEFSMPFSGPDEDIGSLPGTASSTSTSCSTPSDANNISLGKVEVTNAVSGNKDHVQVLTELCPNFDDNKDVQVKRRRSKRLSGSFRNMENGGQTEEPSVSDVIVVKSSGENTLESSPAIVPCDKENDVLHTCTEESITALVSGYSLSDDIENIDDSLAKQNARGRRSRRASIENQQKIARFQNQSDPTTNQDIVLVDIYTQKTYKPVTCRALGSIKEIHTGSRNVFGKSALRLINFPENYLPSAARKTQRKKKSWNYRKTCTHISDEEFRSRLRDIELALDDIE